ncbi:hypothetical protein MJO28_003315 [Puccinia striiformis f. sp. tritici]|uniref:ELYS-like domain-containing protein n=4 Tax=Puccinia striiformis TaxID=27350 RepID=A0A0L0VTL7_9BASI|nr:hypothetical protein Pst134EA_004761 [Puccinia striiformis f. sp. tritici]KAI9613508.1 hypothetical protein H4Q26_010114 [Puccinia striiformis f. sp. tritici PST-130]KNF02547.1 hypothetical protein PSTG_04145 [Puccinia striiformis f. sp. tritici PST-78]POW06850.1 hypothetical protein PSTT_08671 [Puccinia striiformis]KAH9461921.1 hypothetical protein Pst134EB_005840 [Puccinia striiformis f. sp. tritici]KAH9470841.1 hypothetical protein Pst134EA_004761 [Puccinia striiformis f. sp. tritici]
MDQSIFSLFTTKDWPFQSATRASDVSEADKHAQKDKLQSKTDKLLAKKRLRSRDETIDGMLFFDRLMKLGSIPNFKDLFPPPHPSRLRQLLDSIDACGFDLLKKNCLVYYLLKEYGDGRETRFAIDRLIPSHFSRGLDGLWALDHSQWQSAIRAIADPTVTPDFLPEIIQTLATQPRLKHRSNYLMRFYLLTQPSLDLPSVVFVLRAMCINCNLRAAWALQRSYGRPERDRLLTIIFETCFGLNDFGQPLGEALQILIAFPFDELEDTTLSRFAISAPRLLPGSHSMVAILFYLSKLTSEARYIEAIRFERELSQSAGIVSNPDIDRVIRGIAEMLPEVQRNMLELEFDQQHPVLNPTQASNGMALDPSNDMDLSASYDVCSLAWDPPASPPALPPPSSLAEARTQQELLNPPKASVPRTSLPLSASPFLRRAMPRMSLDKSNVPQKVLLKALAYTRQPSAPSSPAPHQEPVPMDQVIEEGDSDIPPTPASSRPTPRFTHFVGPSRLPSSASKPPPPPPNFSTSFARSSVAATGSPFHRLSFPDVGKPSPSTGEDRWPTRIVFTPRRPSQQKKMAVEERVPNQVSRSTQSRTEVRDTADSESSGDESPNVSQPTSNPPKQRQHLAAVVVPRDNRRELKSPPKKMARVTKSSTRRAPQIDRVLPGGFNLDDEEMDEPSPAAPEETNESSAEASKAQSRSNHYQPTNRSSTTTRKKTRGDNQNHDNNNQVQRSTGTATVPPITPRRSNRLTTPAKRRVLPGGMIDHDSIDEDDDDQRLPQEPQNSKKTPAKPKTRKKVNAANK